MMRVAFVLILCLLCFTGGDALRRVRLSHHINVLEQNTNKASVVASARAGAAAHETAEIEALVRPADAKGPWPPLPPLVDKDNQRTETEMQYQYRTCNNFKEWNAYYAEQQHRLTMYHRYLMKEQEKINALTPAEQNNHENTLKIQKIKDAYAELVNEFNALTKKVSKGKRFVEACTPNVRGSITNKITDSAKEQASIEAAIKLMEAKELLAKTECELVKTANNAKPFAIATGIACGAAIGNYADQVFDTDKSFSKICAIAGGFVGVEVVDRIIQVIKKHVNVPESVVATAEAQLVTQDIIDAQCKDRRKDAKAALDAARLPYSV